MTPRERVFAASRHGETDEVPRNFMLSPPAEAVLREHYATKDLQAALGIHLHLFGCAGKSLYAMPREYGPTITDEFGVVWSTSEIDRGYAIGHPLTHAALEGYEFPNPHAESRWAPVAEAAAAYPECFRIAVIGDLWERAHFMRGLEALLLDLHEALNSVHELLDRVCEYNLITLGGMARLAPDGV